MSPKLNSRLLISQRSGGSIPLGGMGHIGSGLQENKNPRLVFSGKSALNGFEQLGSHADVCEGRGVSVAKTKKGLISVPSVSLR